MAEQEFIQEKQNPLIVGVRFSKISKSYNFDATSMSDIKFGDFVVVQTTRGWQLGEVVDIIEDVSTLELDKIKKVERKATESDLRKREEIEENEQEANMRIAKWIRELNVKDGSVI